MMKNLDELMMRMCAHDDRDGVGVEVDGVIYFYEDFPDNDGMSRAYKHFDGKNITFYSRTWARQRRVKRMMDCYKSNILSFGASEAAAEYAAIIAEYIVRWSNCTKEKALEQVEGLQVNYLSII